jgi:beta-lactamase class A
VVYRFVRVAAVIGLVGAGTAAGWVISSRSAASGEAEQGRIEGVRWTSPYIEAAGVRDGSPRLVGFRTDVARYISDLRTRDPSLGVSLYVRDLEHGAWTGVGENDMYVPASLMKVAVLFHALSRLEDDPGLADASLRYPGPDSMPSPDNLLGAPVPIHMVPGESYTFLDLLDRMVRHSDNHAKDLLMQGVGSGEVDDLMMRIGVPAQFDGGQAVMTPRAYAALFRMLYRSSVFSRRTSELGLDLLLRADFDRGLRAGLPADVPIASKYGIYFDPRNLRSGQQLHECGIIYPPNHPFVICVMTRSLLKGPPELAEILSEVARRAYLALPDPTQVGVPGRNGG